MNRLLSEFLSTPPSPRTPSVTRIPFTLGGQTMPVGWNWMNSMLISEAPARSASGHDHCGALEQDEVAAFAVIAEHTRDRVAVFDQLGDRTLGEDLDPGFVVTQLGVVFLLQRDDLLLHRADQLQAGAVADVREPRVGVSAE